MTSSSPSTSACGRAVSPVRRDAVARLGEAFCLLGLSMVAAFASAADDETGNGSMSRQRADIAAQRQAVQRRFEEKERDCQQRFVVTACLNAAQKERRESLTPLRQEEIRIDTLQRKQRAAARLDEIEAKQRADAAKEEAAAASAAARSTPARTAQPPASAAVLRPPSLPSPPSPIPRPAPPTPISDEERQRREAASLARFESSQAEAQQRQAAAAARNAKRAASGKVVRPLPTPPEAASAP